MRVLCIGKSVIETTCVINEKVEEGKTYKITNKVDCSGGMAGNIAYLLGKWGVETYIASMLGPDDGAAKIKKEYETIGIKTDYLETSYDKKTGQSIVVVNDTTKSKTIFNLESGSFLKKYAFGIEVDAVVSDGNDFNATVSAFDKYENKPTYLVISNYDKEAIELCKYAKNIIFNKNTAELATNMRFDYNNSASLVNIYNSLKQKFSKADLIITLGERGCIYSINGQVKILPPVRVGIVDTNGAKDVFAGAYVFGMLKSFDIEKALTYATIAASLSTTKLTSRNSIPALMDVSNYYDSKFGKQNNPNVNINQNNVNINNSPNINNGNPSVNNNNINNNVNNGSIPNQGVNPNLNSNLSMGVNPNPGINNSTSPLNYGQQVNNIPNPGIPNQNVNVGVNQTNGSVNQNVNK